MPRIVSLAVAFCVVAIVFADAPAAAQRQPEKVASQLTSICEKAGFGRNGLADCGKAFEKTCRGAGLDPKSQRCWQHLLDQDDRKALDYQVLRRTR
jgi:hypothetical protein